MKTELSLFTGIGCGLISTKKLGFTSVGYVEIDGYCQKVLLQRIKDGLIDNAPIYGDIREFIDQGYANQYKKMVSLITAGFPCQPFSQAGKKKGEKDQRNKWPETFECIRIIRPKNIFLENVPGLLRYRYFGRIIGEIQSIGYCVQWGVISAWEVGAPHLRKRLWIKGTLPYS